MKKILVIMAVVLATVGGCSVNPYGIHNVEGYAVSEDSFNIGGEIFQIYDDVLEIGETYIITIDGKDTPSPEDDEILNYTDMETYELNGGRI